MKTTIDIADSLLRRAKRLAAKEGTTLREIVEGALRDRLERSEDSEASATLQTHTFQGRGLQPGLSWDDWDSIRALGYEGRGG
jgi:hypothetical protein